MNEMFPLFMKSMDGLKALVSLPSIPHQNLLLTPSQVLFPKENTLISTTTETHSLVLSLSLVLPVLVLDRNPRVRVGYMDP